VLRKDTVKQMIASGQWCKIGKKRYEHASGAAVWYDHNSFGWRIDESQLVWSTLWIAKMEVERKCNS
jgi:hypothetical protein